MVVEGKIKPIDALAKNILTARFEDFDPATLDNAKNRVMDVLGCIIGGAKAERNAGLVRLI
jgi:2-methylcitrate dehydratase PrpD